MCLIAVKARATVRYAVLRLSYTEGLLHSADGKPALVARVGYKSINGGIMVLDWRLGEAIHWTEWAKRRLVMFHT
jgi:hypothetical protein